MNNFLADIKDVINDRFRSPFWISTIISWLVINWELTITALFQSAEFNKDFVDLYIKSSSNWSTIYCPIIAGLIYSIFSGSLKETIEIAAKLSRSLLIKLDRSGALYQSIPIKEHKEKIARLQRQLQRAEEKQKDNEEILDQNDELHKRIEEIDNRDQNLLAIIESDILNSSIDDDIRKLRFLRKLHKVGFALTLSEDDIPPSEADKKKTSIDTSQHTHNAESILKSVNQKNREIPKDTLDRAIKAFEHKSLSDPYSHKTLLLTLLLCRSLGGTPNKMNPENLGLDITVFNKSLKNAISSGLVSNSAKKFIPTSNGNQKIKAI